ncbi:MAG: hypothetical protein KAI76_07310 [Alphaproteobacteria bacterium]|nr:hypothetical protein [Alphaproteobacteria bacterium]
MSSAEDESILNIAAIRPLVEEPCKEMLGFYLKTSPDKTLDHTGQPQQPTSVSEPQQPTGVSSDPPEEPEPLETS